MEVKPFIYQFDDLRVDLKAFRVFKADTPIQLEPKALEVLIFLIENRGRLVEKKELLDAVWKDAFVTENAMTRVIAQLRKALGDDSKEAKYIETVPTRGYRFIPEVELCEVANAAYRSRGGDEQTYLSSHLDPHVPQMGAGRAASSAEYVISQIRRHKVGASAVLTALVIAVSAVFYFTWASRMAYTRGKAIDSIAVLPFANSSGEPNTEYLSDGISESIIYSLSQLSSLRVMSLNSVLRYKGRETSAQAAGQELKVQAVLTVRVVQRGDNLSISAELVDVGNNSSLWGKQYHQKLSDILQVQEEIARKITEKLRLRLTGEEEKRLAKSYTENAEAYQLFLKGRYHLNRRTARDFEKSIDYFQQAIKLDPDFALAYALLAHAWQSIGVFGTVLPGDVYPKARAAVEKALELDDQLAEAYTVRGMIKNNYDWDKPGAEKDLKRALELNPNIEMVHHLYAIYLMTIGRLDEALVGINQALEIDPTFIITNRDKAQILFHARQYDEAIEQSLKTIDLDPNFPGGYYWLGRAYEEKGLAEQAIAAYLKSSTLSNDRGPEEVAALREASTVSGLKGYWRKWIEQAMERAKRNSYFDCSSIAPVYAQLGEKDKAFECLESERSYRERRSYFYLRIDPRLDSLRSDPRFTDLLRRVGLSQ